MKNHKGLYIVLEGIPGSGKTTQSKFIIEYLKQKFPKKEIVYTREPGGSEIAENIRKAVQGTKYTEKMESVCDAYLYAASRAQALRTVVLPELKAGKIVLSDRSFISSLAYQGHAQGLGLQTVLNINKEAIKGLEPDLILIYDVDPKITHSRLQDHENDKWENMDVKFFTKVRAGYKKSASVVKNAVVINAKGSIEEIFNKTKKVLDAYFR